MFLSVYEGDPHPPPAAAAVPESAGLCVPLPSLDVHGRLGHYHQPPQGQGSGRSGH